MQAPQYGGREALEVRVYPGALRGNLSEIKVLNQYIGVRIPDRLPQNRWLPTVFGLTALVGVASGWLPGRARPWAAGSAAVLLAGAVLAAAVQAQWQMRQIGHDRDHHAALVGIQDFTPPLLGHLKLANFELSSGLGLGSGFIGVAFGLYVGVMLSGQSRPREAGAVMSRLEAAPAPSPHQLEVGR